MDSNQSISPLTTYGGYAVLAGTAGLLYLYGRRNNRRGAAVSQSSRQARPIEANEAISSPSIKKKAEKAEKATKPKPKSKPSAAATEAPQAVASGVDFDADKAAADEKKADREFARQLANAHAGTKFESKKADEKRQKSVKQSKAQEAPEAAGESSNAGDADDDMSSQTSPIVAAASGNDVSDMLEPVAAAPSVLRLTDTDAVKPKSKKAAKAPEVVETKKQRQNRKKAEAAKAAREADEKERQKLMEQQRRTARVAEGRAAKDGTAFMASQNAWNGKSEKEAPAPVQLLDTFEQKKPEVKPAPVATSGAPSKKSQDEWQSGVPSEEEQMEMLRQEDSWNEVKTKKKGKKTSASEAPVATNGVTTTTVPSVSAAKPAPANGTAKKGFAALEPEETEDVDQEWDV